MLVFMPRKLLTDVGSREPGECELLIALLLAECPRRGTLSRTARAEVTVSTSLSGMRKCAWLWRGAVCQEQGEGLLVTRGAGQCGWRNRLRETGHFITSGPCTPCS